MKGGGGKGDKTSRGKHDECGKETSSCLLHMSNLLPKHLLFLFSHVRDWRADPVARNREALTDSLHRLFSVCPPPPPNTYLFSILLWCSVSCGPQSGSPRLSNPLSSGLVWPMANVSRSLKAGRRIRPGPLPLEWPWTSYTSWTKVTDPLKAAFFT